MGGGLVVNGVGFMFGAGSVAPLEGFLRKRNHAARPMRRIAPTPPPTAPAIMGVLFVDEEVGAAEVSVGYADPDALCPAPVVAGVSVLETADEPLLSTHVGVPLTVWQV